jgi:lipopolysaccharide transport system permease protein
MVLIYLVVFVFIFKLRVGSGEGTGASAVYLMAGIFPWIILADGLSRGSSALIENANLIQKTYFPTEILIAKVVLAPFLNFGLALILLAAFQLFTGGFWGIPLILPCILLLQVFFTIGLAFICSAFSVFFRDILQVVQIIVSMWVYATPIFYETSMLPPWAAELMYLNPLFPFIEMYHTLFISGTIASWRMPALALLWAALFYVSGAFIFTKLKAEFADWL